MGRQVAHAGGGLAADQDGRRALRDRVGRADAGGHVADPGGRLLFGVAALGLFVLAAVDLALRPRLTADRDGVQVHTLTGVRRLPWPALERVDVDERTRYGLVSRALELEAAGHLIVLSRRTLGADPRDVADALAKIRYTA